VVQPHPLTLEACRAEGRSCRQQRDHQRVLQRIALFGIHRTFLVLEEAGHRGCRRSFEGLRRQPDEQRARETALALAREREPAMDLELLLAEGAALSAEEAHRLSFS
jgi:hypothetical protein